jgi:NADPH-dependent 2,4-dienoyl-CoA reductase/sulfur reductase-like enzyme
LSARSAGLRAVVTYLVVAKCSSWSEPKRGADGAFEVSDAGLLERIGMRGVRSARRSDNLPERSGCHGFEPWFVYEGDVRAKGMPIMRSRQTERVVVVGGGYAGTVAALRLAGRARRRASVTLVDPKDSFVQRLRLHQVATGQKVAQPAYGKLLRRKVAFVKGSAERIV